MEKIKVGIIGTGHRTAHLHGSPGGMVTSIESRADGEVVALCDIDKSRLKNAASLLNKPVAEYTDYKELLARNDFDAVYISTPNYLHKEITTAALKAGKHVLVEKPMATTLADCDAMIEASEKSGKILFVGLNMRYHRWTQKVTELIKSGIIGRPVMIWCTEFRGPFADSKKWVFDKEKSGGALVEKNCHHFDLFNWWAESDAASVSAIGGTLNKSIYGIPNGILDHAWANVEYKNGVQAMLGICLFTPHGKGREIGIVGTEGTILHNSCDDENLRLINSGTKDETVFHIDGGVYSAGMFEQFFDCIKTGKKPLTDGKVGRRSIEIAIAAEESVLKKQTVNIK